MYNKWGFKLVFNAYWHAISLFPWIMHICSRAEKFPHVWSFDALHLIYKLCHLIKWISKDKGNTHVIQCTTVYCWKNLWGIQLLEHFGVGTLLISIDCLKVILRERIKKRKKERKWYTYLFCAMVLQKEPPMLFILGPTQASCYMGTQASLHPGMLCVSIHI